ncbi:MAG: aldehyde dehydrogenase family protein [Clostridiales bacterium]|nr:aldehyde dehydrogenase family protein [Clostridiales bacterium]MBQ3107068.1 aldehyde dehydrogenase family protein [Bacillota bacterium]
MEQWEFDSYGYVERFISKAGMAQKVAEKWTQEEADKVVRAICRAVYDNAEELAKLAVEETGMGNVEDKIAKINSKAPMIWNSVKKQKTVGILKRDEEKGLIEIAKPVGIVGALTPATNPVVTLMSNAMFALKGRNAIVFSAHHTAMKTGARTVELMRQALAAEGCKEDMIQILDRPDRNYSKMLMQRADLVLATGGSAMVDAAHRSGRPAIGVGSGNVQCIIDTDANLEEAVPAILKGRAFDNGMLCTAEQSVFVPEELVPEFLRIAKANGGYHVWSTIEGELLRQYLFKDGKFNQEASGKDAAWITEKLMLKTWPGSKVFLVPTRGVGPLDLMSREKMCPVLAFTPYNGFSHAVSMAESNLGVGGKGHSVSLWSNTPEHVEEAALKLAASRFVVNQCCALTAGGSFQNGLAPSNTLGCGTWGRNSISENLDCKHLINVVRVAYPLNKETPSEEEIWSL